MRIVCTSDTHERHKQIVVPAGDVLIHAGDLTMRGTLPAIYDAFDWLSSLPHERIVFVPGNHDFAFEREATIVSDLAEKYPRVEVLIDSATVVNGYRMYGSPYQPWFHDWAFNFPRGLGGQIAAEATWNRIPDDVEILVTHGPVRGVLDRTATGEDAGCSALLARIASLTKLRLYVCGHIHEAYGTEKVGNVLYVNASACDLKYRATQNPIVVEFGETELSIVI